MIDSQDSHIGTPPSAALSDLSKGFVIHTQESDRAGREACRGIYY